MTDETKELKKEIIRLKSLNRRAANEIRDLDKILIDCVENNKVPQYNEEDPMFPGFSSINLLSRLDSRINGGYVENYEDLKMEMKVLEGHSHMDDEDETILHDRPHKDLGRARAANLPIRD